ncbi:hypothetical protein BOTNAR_0154g00110 [Botryotinia narcissicola]|uniref:Uncharacterized protein n=1 Tax=Botryotinia narcissicola TaxID=278944 RepID=A0A4Z1IEA1_9HELO|nr:hypothetical protein BOTNAR_0154g00110 [Botryotinia narcissicola]
MGTKSSDLQAQIMATQRKRQEEKTGGSGSLFLDEIKPDTKPVLAHPQPNWNKYTVAKFSKGIDRINLEASQKDKADSQPSANEHSAARRNTSLQQKSPPKPNAPSTLVPPQKRNNHKISGKAVTPKPVLESNIRYPGKLDYGEVLVAQTYLSSQLSSKVATLSQSGSQHKISNIPGKRPGHHGAHNNMKIVSNDRQPPDRRTPAKDERTNSTRGQNKEIIVPKTRGYPPLPPRNTHTKYGSSTSQQHPHPQAPRPRAVASQHPRPTTSGMQDSRQVKPSVPRSHKNQRNDSQRLVNYSYPSDRFAS